MYHPPPTVLEPIPRTTLHAQPIQQNTTDASACFKPPPCRAPVSEDPPRSASWERELQLCQQRKNNRGDIKKAPRSSTPSPSATRVEQRRHLCRSSLFSQTNSTVTALRSTGTFALFSRSRRSALCRLSHSSNTTAPGRTCSSTSCTSRPDA